MNDPVLCDFCSPRCQSMLSQISLLVRQVNLVYFSSMRANILTIQVKHSPMWLEALIMWPQKSCGNSTVQNVMFGVPGLSFISY